MALLKSLHSLLSASNARTQNAKPGRTLRTERLETRCVFAASAVLTGNTLNITDSTGEVNNITFTVDTAPTPDTITVKDGGVTIGGPFNTTSILAIKIDAGTKDDTVNATGLDVVGYWPFGISADLGIGNDTFKGTSSTLLYGENVWGDTGNDTIYGNGGADYLYGEDGNDWIYGGAGSDYIEGGPGENWLEGGNDNDKITGGNKNDSIFGGSGNDSLYGGGDGDFIWGGDGNDEIKGEDGNDTLYGDNDDDRLVGGAGSDTLYGGIGADYLEDIEPALDSDYLYGGDGDDELNAEDFDNLDTIVGGAGNDIIFGDNGDSKTQ